MIVLKDTHASHALLPAQLRGSAVSAPALQALAEPFVASLFAPTVFLPVQHSMNMCFSKTLLYCPLSDSGEDQLIFVSDLSECTHHSASPSSGDNHSLLSAILGWVEALRVTVVAKISQNN